MSRRALACAVAVITASSLLGACDGDGRRTSARRDPASTSSAPASSSSSSTSTTSTTLAPPPPLAWHPCGAYQCATLTVPLDYAHAGGRTIGVAVIRHPAGDPAHRIGSLVLDPGGPGESGLALIGRDLGLLPPRVRSRFDVVELDPRGVGQSGAIRCSGGSGGDGGGGGAPGPDPAPSTPPAIEQVVRANAGYAQLCAAAAGPLLGHVGSVDVARDLDQLRRALGDAQLTYVGLSYGTLLGATYADLFPTHVRALALDGAIDPARSMYDLQVDEARAFEDALNGFFSACVPGCGWRPSGDPTAALLALFDRLRAHPLPAGAGKQAGPDELYLAIVSRLYSPSRRGSLASALAAAERGDGGPIRSLADAYEGRTPGATINADASNSINCLDHPVPRDAGALAAQAAGAAKVAPVFGPILVWGGIVCAVWPALPTREPHPVHAPGAPPIVVVGTTRDPVTPYPWAQALAGELEHGVLLTRDGSTHVALFSSGCVRATLDAYLVDLHPPAPGTVCSS
ncbi:MAG TPA: alpha/beta hydrolase [Acidimicrobiia bacterium]